MYPGVFDLQRTICHLQYDFLLVLKFNYTKIFYKIQCQFFKPSQFTIILGVLKIFFARDKKYLRHELKKERIILNTVFKIQSLIKR